MKTKALKTVKTINPTDIPDGVYPGRWSGDVVTFRAGEVDYTTYTQTTIRGVNISCTVTVSAGNVGIVT